MSQLSDHLNVKSALFRSSKYIKMNVYLKKTLFVKIPSRSRSSWVIDSNSNVFLASSMPVVSFVPIPLNCSKGKFLRFSLKSLRLLLGVVISLVNEKVKRK